MTAKPSNIYEDEDNKFSEENDRLADFDLPTAVSKQAIGSLDSGLKFLDVGAGPNTSLFSYVSAQDVDYTALDKNEDFLRQQKDAGATVINADARDLAIDDGTYDITHTRFVISHLGNEKRKAIREILRVTKPGGRAIFLDYDWTTAHGSKAFEKVKDFMINGGFLFDADFGDSLEGEVKASRVKGEVKRVNYAPVQMMDYSQVIKLREAGTTDLKMQGKDEGAANWNSILDDLQKEADSDNAPGFYFPGIVAVIFIKD